MHGWTGGWYSYISVLIMTHNELWVLFKWADKIWSGWRKIITVHCWLSVTTLDTNWVRLMGISIWKKLQEEVERGIQIFPSVFHLHLRPLSQSAAADRVEIRLFFGKYEWQMSKIPPQGTIFVGQSNPCMLILNELFFCTVWARLEK